MALMIVMLGVAAYLLGAIPFGLLIGLARGIDVRRVGSGNIGATNVMRALGPRWGLLALALDALKGFAPAFWFPLALPVSLAGPARGGCALGFACLAVAGHVWPVYLKFKGGKGVATAAGALLGVAPLAGVVGLLVWLLVFLAARYVSAASMAGAAAAAATAWLRYAADGWVRPAVLTLLAGLTIWRHRENMRRLAQGTENRIVFGKRPPPDGGPEPGGGSRAAPAGPPPAGKRKTGNGKTGNGRHPP